MSITILLITIATNGTLQIKPIINLYKTTKKMKKLLKVLAIAFITAVLIASYLYAPAQNVVRDINGNFKAIGATKDTTTAKVTGKTFTDTKGNTYPVYVSKNDKLFVIRTSKTGNQYKQYLKVD